METSLRLTSSHGLTSPVQNEVYVSSDQLLLSPTITKASQPHDPPQALDSQKKGPPPLTIPTDHIALLEESYGCAGRVTPPQWKLSFSKFIATEVLTCLHEDVFIRPIAGKLFSLVVRLLNCYEVQLMGLIGHRVNSLSSLDTHTTVDISGATSTPIKGATLSSSVPSSAGGAVSTGPTLTVDDLILALLDVVSMSRWIESCLMETTNNRILGKAYLVLYYLCDLLWSSVRWMLGRGPDPSSPITRCLLAQSHSIHRLVPIIWNKMGSVIISQCRNNLKVSYLILYFPKGRNDTSNLIHLLYSYY
jgi:hypothetical protein